MFKSCSRCGRIHEAGRMCRPMRAYHGGTERKLRSLNIWKQKSIDIREAAQNLCEVCRAQGIITYDGLEVHHIVKVKDDESLLLDNYNLICLCTAHHKLADDGKLSADYLRDLAARRETRL